MPRTERIYWPVLGEVKKSGYSQPPKFTTRKSQNVRTKGVIEGLMRGGSRPGFGRFTYDQLGSGARIDLLGQVTYIRRDGYYSFSDHFEGGQLGANWTTAAWKSYSPRIEPENDSAIVKEEDCGVVLDAISPAIDTDYTYNIDLFINTYKGSHDGTYEIYCSVSVNLGAPEKGVIVTLTLSPGGGYDGNITYYQGNLAPPSVEFALTPGDITYDHAGVFRVNVNQTTEVISAYWQGNLLITKTFDSSVAAGADGISSFGSRLGFGMQATTAGRLALADWFRVQYYRDAASERVFTTPIAASNGVLSYQGLLGKWLNRSGTLLLATGHLLHYAELHGKAYIADYDDVSESRATGTISADGATLDDANVSDWTATSPTISAADDCVVISSGCADSTRHKTYTIATVHATNGITLNDPVDTGTGDTGVTYRIEPCPKYFDPSDVTVYLWTATNGAVPTGCRCIGLYRERIVLGGARVNPHQWFMSRSGDPRDWNASEVANDKLRAVFHSDANQAGVIGDPITAIMTFSDHYMFFGCESSIYRLVGDPTSGGRLQVINKEIGVVDKGAWCHGPNDEIYFLSLDGLYYIAPGTDTFPQSVSHNFIPNDLKNVSRDQYTVTMVYDVKERGVRIHLTGNAFEARKHWFFDIENGAFWPDVLSNANHEPTAVATFQGEAGEMNTVVVGTRDGYVNMPDRRFETDLGTEITSYIYLGPIKMGDEFREGEVQDLIARMAEDSGDVDWFLYCDDSHEIVLHSSSIEDGTWGEGLNYTDHPKRNGYSMMLRIENNSTTRSWSLEKITARLETLGEMRKL